MKKYFWLFVVAFVATVSIGGTSFAQVEKSSNDPQLESILEQARKSGSTIVVIGAPNTISIGDKNGVADMMVMEKQAMVARKNMRAIISESPKLVDKIIQTIQALDKDKSATWPLWAIGLALLYLLIGYGIEYLFHGWSRPHFAYFCKADPDTRSEKIAYLLFRGIMQAMALLIQTGIAVILVISFDDDLEHMRTLQFIVIIAIFGFRVTASFFQNLLAYDTAPHRLLAIDDAQALRLNRSALIFTGVLASVIGANVWAETLNLDTRSEQFIAIFFSLTAMIVEAIIVYQRRTDVAAILLGPGDLSIKWKPRIFFARMWHIVTILYFMVSFAVTAVRVALDQPNAMGLTNMPILAIFCGIVLFGIALLAIEWTFEHRGQRLKKSQLTVDSASDSDDDRPMVPQKT
jgi:moderate conductance mechanosensitive channel